MKIKRGIFQGNSLSPFLFILVMIPLTLVLRQTRAYYELKKGGKKINRLPFMDVLKLFAKNADKRDSLGYTRCGLLIMKRGKIVKSEGINMPDGNMMMNEEI